MTYQNETGFRHDAPESLGVLLLNLGTPDAPTVSGAPLENNIVERALKLAIRQRKNSLFHASEHSAYVASVLTSLIATGVQAGVDVLSYLVALQTHRQAVFRDPGAWLPWNYPLNPEPG